MLDRIAGLEMRHLVLGAIQLGVALEVAEVAIGLYFEEARSITAPGARNRLACYFVDGESVVFADAHTRNPVARGALAVIGNRRRLRLRHGDCPGVVFDNEYDGQLPKGREIQRL